MHNLEIDESEIFTKKEERIIDTIFRDPKLSKELFRDEIEEVIELTSHKSSSNENDERNFISKKRKKKEVEKLFP